MEQYPIKMKNISVIIKALNEEKHIAKCIESALVALRESGGNNEVILVDSYSSDKTVEIAKKYPIKIIQLKKDWLKTPAAALQTGYLHSKGKFIYVLDGDMQLNKDSLKKLLPYLKEENVAGVAGIMKEPPVDNIISKRFQKRYKKFLRIGEANYLDGGGLYKRPSIEKVGYLANPYLHSAEEADLGYQLQKKGFKLLRLNLPTVMHHFYRESGWKIMKNKWKRGYMKGPGQILKGCFRNRYVLQHLIILEIYFFVIFWWIIGLVSLFLSIFAGKNYFIFYALLSCILLIILFLKKKSITDVLFSIYSWSIQGLGMVIGFFENLKNPGDYPKDVIIIKN